MRHRVKKLKLSRNEGERKALLRALVCSLLKEESIVTTVVKAKVARREVDRLVTLAKTDNLHHRRLAYRFLQDRRLVKKLFEDIALRFKDNHGGVTRVLKLGKFRRGDGAPLGILELVVKKERKKVKRIRKKEPHVKTKKEVKKDIEKREKIEKKERPPRGRFRENIRKIFKKERDAL